MSAWIVSTSETVKSLTAGIDSVSKEQLEIVLIKLNVIFKSALFSLSVLVSQFLIRCVFRYVEMFSYYTHIFELISC